MKRRPTEKLTWLNGDDADSVTAAVQRLVIVCNHHQPVFRIELHFGTEVLGVGWLRRHGAKTIARPAFLILDLVVLDVVAVWLLRRQQLETTQVGKVNHQHVCRRRIATTFYSFVFWFLAFASHSEVWTNCHPTTSGARVDNARHHLGLSHRSTGPSLLDAISFNRHHNGSVQYGNDSA